VHWECSAVIRGICGAGVSNCDMSLNMLRPEGVRSPSASSTSALLRFARERLELMADALRSFVLAFAYKTVFFCERSCVVHSPAFASVCETPSESFLDGMREDLTIPREPNWIASWMHECDLLGIYCCFEGKLGDVFPW